MLRAPVSGYVVPQNREDFSHLDVVPESLEYNPEDLVEMKAGATVQVLGIVDMNSRRVSVSTIVRHSILPQLTTTFVAEAPLEVSGQPWIFPFYL